MDSLLRSDTEQDQEDQGTSKLSRQALAFSLHTFLALASWIALMLVGYAVNPAGVPQLAIEFFDETHALPRTMAELWSAGGCGLTFDVHGTNRKIFHFFALLRAPIKEHPAVQSALGRAPRRGSRGCSD